MDDTFLSKTLAHALRHAPWLYELEIDDEGWTPVAALLGALRERRLEWEGLAEDDLHALLARADKRRYEISEGKIRALYGHSLQHKLSKEPAQPPETLYHGTPRGALDAIRAAGLKPMSRQYVHLSTDMETARQVGQRRDQKPAVLVVRAGDAHRAGLTFYRGNEQVWLADHVPPEFITFPHA